MSDSSRTRPIALAAALLVGALLALQSRLNAVLAGHTGRPIVAALWSFGSGLALLTLAGALSPRLRGGVRGIRDALRGGRLRWWQCLGGVFGGLLVAVQAWSVPQVGVAIFSVATVGGQTINALAVDRLGLGPAGVQRVTGVRVVAAIVALIGVTVSATGHHGAGGFAVLPAVLAFLVGAGIAVQQAFNGRVSAANRSPMATTWQNFLVGMITLLLLAAILRLQSATGWAWPDHAPWWAWFGGPAGIAFIALTAWAVRVVGVLVFGLTAVAGQLIAALVLDLLDSATRKDVGAQLVVGLLITLGAAVGASLANRRQNERGKDRGQRDRAASSSTA